MLQPYYQPLIDLKSGQITGFEALVRWPHGERGMISPAEFIPVAEETGLINAVGGLMLRRACMDAAQWPDDVRVAVNLSPLQFRVGNLLSVVMDALKASGLSPKRLELEITETLLLDKSDQVLATLHALRALGVRISMDDFGTGYSSLSYLRSFPFDKIKIDQSFVRDLGSNHDAQAIVRSIISLGMGLGVTITAEGVETEAELSCLRAEGCHEGQGLPVRAARGRMPKSPSFCWPSATRANRARFWWPDRSRKTPACAGVRLFAMPLIQLRAARFRLAKRAPDRPKITSSISSSSPSWLWEPSRLSRCHRSRPWRHASRST